MPAFIDRTGLIFGRINVIKLAETRKKGKDNVYMWLCGCDCGNQVEVRSDNLPKVGVRGCGCTRSTKNMKRGVSNNKYSHGKSGTRIHKIWKGMRDRCYNENNPAYLHYGGRGILICDEWCDYVSFHEWSLANGYNKELTIDRINNDGNYCPNNCRWATIDQQSNNRRNNVYVTSDGVKMTIKQWSDHLKIKDSKIRYLIKTKKMSIKEIKILLECL